MAQATIIKGNKTPAEIMASLREQMDEVDTEADEAARDEARAAAEDSDMETQSPSGLPSLLPVEFSVMRGLGVEGPHRIFIPQWVPTGKIDEDGEQEFRIKVVKKWISPFRMKVQLQASEALSAVHEDTFRAALVWSFKKGEGDLDAQEVVDILEKVYPKTYLSPDGEKIDREPFTPESVTALFNGAIRGIRDDNYDAMNEFVALALQGRNPDITVEWIEENLDYGLMVRIMGKILYLNGGLRDRFLP